MRRIEFNRSVTITSAISTLGVCIFCILCIWAMRNYQSPSGRSYAITMQYLSDLGAYDSNVRGYFNWGLILLGMTLLPFFATIPASDMNDLVWLKLIGVAGAIASLGIIGLGVIPEDFDAHNVMLAIWAIPMPLIIVSFLAALSVSQPRGIFIPFLWLTVAISMILATLSYLHATVLLQKVAVVALLFWFPAMVVFAIQSSSRIVEFPSLVDDDAIDYIVRLRDTHFARAHSYRSYTTYRTYRSERERSG